MKIGSKIKKLRRTKKMSQTELGKKLGVTKQMIVYYEKDVNFPTKQKFELMMDALDVDINYFLSQEDRMVYLTKLKPYDFLKFKSSL